MRVIWLKTIVSFSSRCNSNRDVYGPGRDEPSADADWTTNVEPGEIVRVALEKTRTSENPGHEQVADSGSLDYPEGYLVKTKILVSVLVTFFTWALCGVGDVHAGSLEADMPSTGESIVVGVGVALLITVIIVSAMNSGDDEKAEEAEEAEKAEEAEETVDTEEEVVMSGVGPAAKSQLRIDPVLTLQKNGVGAGVALSF